MKKSILTPEEKKAKKAAYDKAYYREIKSHNKRFDFIASSKKKYFNKLRKEYWLHIDRMSDIVLEAGKTNDSIKLEKLSLEYTDLLERMITIHPLFNSFYDGELVNKDVTNEIEEKIKKPKKSPTLKPVDKYSLFASIFNNS